jgi:hypothetical protein
LLFSRNSISTSVFTVHKQHTGNEKLSGDVYYQTATANKAGCHSDLENEGGEGERGKLGKRKKVHVIKGRQTS